MRTLDFSIDIILPAALWPLTEMSTRNLPGGKGWPAHKADNLDISEPCGPPWPVNRDRFVLPFYSC
jgi:hypothetical protein